MSTSDAGELELGGGVGGGGEEATAGAARTTAREYQDELFGRFCHKNPNRDTKWAEQNPPAIKQEETHQALRLDSTRSYNPSDVQIQSSLRPGFTSCLLLTFSKPELRLRRTSDLRSAQQSSLTEPQSVETHDRTFQVDGRTPGACIESVSVCPAETGLCPAKKEDQVITDVNHELGITTDLTETHPPSNGNFRPHEHNGSHLPSHVSQPRSCTGSLTGTETEKDIKHRRTFENLSHLKKLSDPSGNMLSSTMVSVLAAPWSGRLRRTKRFDGTSSSDTQSDLQEVSNTASVHEHGFKETPSQHGIRSDLPDGLHIPRNVPFLSTRRNTAGWSTKSDPSSLDFESKRIMTQTVSLDSSATSLSNTASWSPRLDPNEKRRSPQTGHQGRPSSLSSEPMTSSLLLSLRRVNSNTPNSDKTFIFPDANNSTLSRSPSDQNGKLFTTHLSRTSPNNNKQQRPRPILSPSSISYSTPVTESVRSPASSNHREGKAPDNSLTQQPQTMNVMSASLTSSKHSFQDKRPLDKQQTSVGSESTNSFSDIFLSSPRHSPYDHSTLLKTRSLPRRTILTSTSWWKQVSQEGSSPLSHSDTTNKKDKSRTDSPCQTDNKRLISQILSNRDNNNTSESVSKGNMNLALKTHSPESERLVKQLYSFNVDNREPQKPHSMPDCLPTSKLSTAAGQPTLRHTNNPIKKDVGGHSLTSNLKELPVTTYNTKTSHTPTDGSNKYNGSPPKTNNTPTSLHNMDSQKFTTTPLSHDFSSTLNSQAPISLTTSGLPTTPNTKSASSFQSPPVSSSTNASSAHTLKFSKIANVTPLGFERSYVCLPKPFRSKTASSLISQVDSVTKPKGSSVSTPLTTFSSTTAHSSSILSSSATSVITTPTSITTSSFLTPPATPVTASPSSETTTPKLRSIFSNSLEREPKKQCVGVDGKKERRVTWGDSVDVKCSEPFSAEKSDSSKAQTDSSSLSRQPQSTPSILSLPPGSPTGSTSPVCSTNLNTFSTHVGKGEKYRSFSSDSTDLTTREREKNKLQTGDILNFDQTRRGLTTARQERTLSAESGIVQCHNSAPLSLPPDFSSGLNQRYSAPPYSTLMSSRQTLGEKKAMPQPFSISQSSQSNYTTQMSLNVDPHVAVSTKPPLSPIRPSQPSLAFQRSTATQDGSVCKLSDTDKVNNNHIKDHNQIHSNNQLQFLDNRVHISSQSLSGDKEHTFSSTYVTETLVYSIKPKVDTTAAQKNTTPKALQHGTNTLVSLETKSSQQLNTMQSKEADRRLYSDQSSNNGKSGESYPCSNDGNNSSMKENVLSKSKFYSVEAENEQSPKKSRFALKRSASTPNSNISRSERVSKSYNKMDQMFNRLKQKFSTRRSDDDSSFSWKWKRSSQAPSVSGSSDMSSVSDNSVDSTKTLEERVQENKMVLNHNAANTEETKRLSENRYTIIPALAVGESEMESEFSVWSEKSAPGVNTEDQSTRVEQASKVHLTVHSPADQFDLYKNKETQHKATNPFIPGSDPNADRNSSPTSYLTQCRKSTPSPRSPFSPFSSLSPLSPFPSPDGADDSVFYSPKLQRRRESSSPCEPREGISLGGSRRSRASTGPPSISPVQDRDIASSYADLKYGIEPGRSFSVSSVLSSRSSRPERISTGSRFMSVGDLSQSALSCVDSSKELYECSLTPDWTGGFHYQPTNDRQMSDFLGDASKMRSRSLPRSWTRLMTNWSSEGSPAQSVTTSKPAFLHSPTMNTCHFAWDTEGPPTPPLTPPLSPVSRRMSKPPSLSSSSSSPTFSSSPGAGQQMDLQLSRGHLPSRSYVSSLSTFDESSDSGSDTTTDDEYYLEIDEGGGKETEL